MSEKITLPGLRSYRETLGLTQQDVANMADVNSRTIQRLESGVPTTINTAKSIAAALEVPSYKSLQINKEAGRLKDRLGTLMAFFAANKRCIIAVLLAFSFYGIGSLAQNAFLVTLSTFTLLISPFALPFFLMAHDREDNDASPSKRQLITFSSLFTSSTFVLSLSAPLFVVLGLMKLSDEHLGLLSLSDSPRPPNLVDFITAHHGVIWLLSGFFLIASIVMIYKTSSPKRKGKLDVAMVSFGMMVGILFSFISATLFQMELLSPVIPKSIEVWLISVFLGTMLVSHIVFKFIVKEGTGGARWLFRTGLFSGVMVSAIASTTLHLTFNLYENSTWMIASPDMRIEYSKSSKETSSWLDDAVATPLIWDIQLMVEEDLPVTAEYAKLLSAYNGNLLMLYEVIGDLSPPPYEKLNTPLSTDAINFITQSYMRALLYRKEKGTLRAYQTYLLEHSLPNELKPSLPVMIDTIRPDIQFFWLDKAKNTPADFVKDYVSAPSIIKSDMIFKTLHAALGGGLEMKEYSSNGSTTQYFHGGGLLFEYHDKVPHQDDVFISTEMIRKVLAISKDKLPAMSIRKT
tara:strand:- start:2473 stop:4197 length:1725 start_codon:yes stop_codon:yes gene_type:complete